MRFKGEMEALSKALPIAEQWGYGNLICFLQCNWAEKLMQTGIEPYAAALGAFMTNAEARLFEKEKIKRGEWKPKPTAEQSDVA